MSYVYTENLSYPRFSPEDFFASALGLFGPPVALRYLLDFACSHVLAKAFRNKGKRENIYTRHLPGFEPESSLRLLGRW